MKDLSHIFIILVILPVMLLAILLVILFVVIVVLLDTFLRWEDRLSSSSQNNLVNLSSGQQLPDRPDSR